MAGDFFRPPSFVDVLQTFVKPKTLKRVALVAGLGFGLFKTAWWIGKNPARLLATCVFLGSTIAWGWRWGIVLSVVAANLWGTYRFQSFLHRSELYGWKQIVVACWRVFRMKRRMPRELAKVGLALKKHEATTAMSLGDWRGTQRGIIVRGYTGSIGLAERKVLDRVDDLRAALYVDRIRAKPIGAGTVDLYLEYGEHLRRIIGLEHVPPASHPDKFSFGITETGGPLELFWRLPILWGGVTGSGKSGGIWAAIAGLIASGLDVRFRIVDQDGAEFGIFSANPDSPILQVYETNRERLGLVDKERRKAAGKEYAETRRIRRDMVMAFWFETIRDIQDRYRRLPAQQRVWNVTPGGPLIITIVDELLEFTEQIRENPVSHGSGQLNSRGRRAAMPGWYGTQLALADVLSGWRDLIPQRVCYRTNTRHMTDSILGAGATELGAKAHELEQGLDVGVCYARDQGASFISGRTAFISDDQTATLALGLLPNPAAESAVEAPRWVYHLHSGPGAAEPLEEETGVCGHPGRLLYVGSTNDVQRRVAEHIRDHGHRPDQMFGKWIDRDRTVAQVWPDQASGLTEEYIQINRWEDHLPYNISGTRRERRGGSEEAPF